MGKPIEVSRTEFSAAALREVAVSTRDGAAVQRLLTIALILEGHSRAESARLDGIDRQTLATGSIGTMRKGSPDCGPAPVPAGQRR